MQIEKRLEELGITLPEAATPVANYVTTVQRGIWCLRRGTVRATERARFIRVNLARMRTLKTGTNRQDRWQSA